MLNLSNKKILFFAPAVFNYDVEIKRKLEVLGASVSLYNERPSNNFFIKAIIRLDKKLIHFYILHYFNKIIKIHQNTDFDIIFIVKGEVFTKEIVAKFKKKYSHARFILYLWDSVKNYTDIEKTISEFDRALTFDLEDSKNIKQLLFRPLFFNERVRTEPLLLSHDVKARHDLLFIGTVHSDRWEFLNKIKKEAERNSLSVYYYLYIQSPIIFVFKKLFENCFRNLSFKDAQFQPLSKDSLHSLFECSKAILDIQHPKQTGLTMRTIETLGANRKLLTTNESIALYDFYNPNNILILDRNNPKIPISFLNSPYSKLAPELIFKYSIEGWLSDIFTE